MKKVKIVALTAIPAIVVATALFFTGYLYIQSKEPVPNLPATQTVQAPTTVPLNADTIFNLVNQERIKAGVKPLIRDARLDGSAQQKASDMAQYRYYGHVSPNDNRHGYEYITNISCLYTGENLNQINKNTGDYNKVAVSSWLTSKPHREAMLNKDYTVTGVAVKDNKVVQHFCAR